jgi:hypothetical protein
VFHALRCFVFTHGACCVVLCCVVLCCGVGVRLWHLLCCVPYKVATYNVETACCCTVLMFKLLQVVASCMLHVVASCCMLLHVVTCCCMLLHVVACCYMLQVVVCVAFL